MRTGPFKKKSGGEQPQKRYCKYGTKILLLNFLSSLEKLTTVDPDCITCFNYNI